MKKLIALLCLFHPLSLTVFAHAASPQQEPIRLASSPAETALLFSAAPVGDAYQFRPGDLIEARVYGHPELARQVRVDERGMISLPQIAGEIQAAGLTRNELLREVRSRQRNAGSGYRYYLRLAEYGTAPDSIVVRQTAEGGRNFLLTTPMQFSGAQLSLSLTLNLHNPERIGFGFRILSARGEDAWRRELSVALDGGEYESFGFASAEPGAGPVIYGNDGVTTRIHLRVPARAFQRLANAGKVRMRLGARDFELSDNQLRIFRYFAGRISQ